MGFVKILSCLVHQRRWWPEEGGDKEAAVQQDGSARGRGREAAKTRPVPGTMQPSASAASRQEPSHRCHATSPDGAGARPHSSNTSQRRQLSLSSRTNKVCPTTLTCDAPLRPGSALSQTGSVQGGALNAGIETTGCAPAEWHPAPCSPSTDSDLAPEHTAPHSTGSADGCSSEDMHIGDSHRRMLGLQAPTSTSCPLDTDPSTAPRSHSQPHKLRWVDETLDDLEQLLTQAGVRIGAASACEQALPCGSLGRAGSVGARTGVASFSSVGHMGGGRTGQGWTAASGSGKASPAATAATAGAAAAGRPRSALSASLVPLQVVRSHPRHKEQLIKQPQLRSLSLASIGAGRSTKGATGPGWLQRARVGPLRPLDLAHTSSPLPPILPLSPATATADPRALPTTNDNSHHSDSGAGGSRHMDGTTSTGQCRSAQLVQSPGLQHPHMSLSGALVCMSPAGRQVSLSSSRCNSFLDQMAQEEEQEGEEEVLETDRGLMMVGGESWASGRSGSLGGARERVAGRSVSLGRPPLGSQSLLRPALRSSRVGDEHEDQ